MIVVSTLRGISLIRKTFALFVCLLLLLLPISFAENFNFEYDSNGNIIESIDKHYEYDGFNQLINEKR
jgi:hypothetical protein